MVDKNELTMQADKIGLSNIVSIEFNDNALFSSSLKLNAAIKFGHLVS